AEGVHAALAVDRQRTQEVVELVGGAAEVYSVVAPAGVDRRGRGGGGAPHVDDVAAAAAADGQGRDLIVVDDRRRQGGPRVERAEPQEVGAGDVLSGDLKRRDVEDDQQIAADLRGVVVRGLVAHVQPRAGAAVDGDQAQHAVQAVAGVADVDR